MNEETSDASGNDKPWLFKKGNTVGKGNPHAKKIGEFKSAIYKAVSTEDIDAIIKKAVEQAKDGDKSAREFLFDRLLGKPVAHVEANLDAGNILKTYMGLDLDEV